MALSISLANNSNLAHYFFFFRMGSQPMFPSQGENSWKNLKMLKPFIITSSCKICCMTFQMEPAAANVCCIRLIFEQHHSSPSVLMCLFTTPFWLLLLIFSNFVVLLEGVLHLLNPLRSLMQRTILLEVRTRHEKKDTNWSKIIFIDDTHTTSAFGLSLKFIWITIFSM